MSGSPPDGMPVSIWRTPHPDAVRHALQLVLQPDAQRLDLILRPPCTRTSSAGRDPPQQPPLPA